MELKVSEQLRVLTKSSVLLRRFTREWSTHLVFGGVFDFFTRSFFFFDFLFVHGLLMACGDKVSGCSALDCDSSNFPFFGKKLTRRQMVMTCHNYEVFCQFVSVRIHTISNRHVLVSLRAFFSYVSFFVFPWVDMLSSNCACGCFKNMLWPNTMVVTFACVHELRTACVLSWCMT